MGNAISWTDYLGELAHQASLNEHATDDPFEQQLEQWVSRASPGEARRPAAELIRACRFNRQDELNLGDGLQDGFGLKTLPDCIGDLTHLRVLRLVGNQLRTLPPSIGRLTRLEAIYLFGNRLTNLPDSICNCAALERLYLAGNRIEHLPCEIGAMQKLRVLSAPGNRLQTLPESIGKLSGLRDLYLFDNPLVALPSSIARLTGLERLHLGSEYLRDQFGRIAAGGLKRMIN